jgi:hypothetical protein
MPFKHAGTSTVYWSLLGVLVAGTLGWSAISTKDPTKEKEPTGASLLSGGAVANPGFDRTIAHDLESAFEKDNLHATYLVADGIVTLTGDVSSSTKRSRAGRVAGAVANVQEVVNELRVRPRQFRSLR